MFLIELFIVLFEVRAGVLAKIRLIQDFIRRYESIRRFLFSLRYLFHV